MSMVLIDLQGKDNPTFNEFQSRIIKINGSEDSTFIRSGGSFSWYKKFPLSATYNFFRSSFYDENTEKFYNNTCTVFMFPVNERQNYMSRKQVALLFKKMFSVIIKTLVQQFLFFSV